MNNKELIEREVNRLVKMGILEEVRKDDGSIAPERLLTLSQAKKQRLVLKENEEPVTILPLWHFVPARQDAKHKVVKRNYFFAKEVNLYSYHQFEKRVKKQAA